MALMFNWLDRRKTFTEKGIRRKMVGRLTFCFAVTGFQSFHESGVCAAGQPLLHNLNQPLAVTGQ